MAKKAAPKVSESAPAAPGTPTTNTGAPADAPLNPAVDGSLSAQERLDALTEQHKEMQARADQPRP